VGVFSKQTSGELWSRIGERRSDGFTARMKSRKSQTGFAKVAGWCWCEEKREKVGMIRVDDKVSQNRRRGGANTEKG